MDKLIFLDNGATSYPKPEEVYTFMDHFYRNFGVNPGRSGYDLCMEAGELVEKTRDMLTKFFNGKDPNRLCFSYNSTDALNTETILDVDYNIACRTGLHCAPLAHKQLGTAKFHGAARFGIGPFNTEEHIKIAIEAVKEIAASRRK